MEKVIKNLSEEFPLKILLADDNIVNQKVGAKILEKFGYKVDVASNGIEVLDALNHKTYDLIFMDVQMPEMDGLEATKDIHNKFGEKSPRIIAMTATGTKEDKDICINNGMDDYISKPIRVDELSEALKRSFSYITISNYQNSYQ